MSGGDDIEASIAACASGSARHGEQVLAAYRALDVRSPQRDSILDALARMAPESPVALDVLIQVVYDERFVRAEIRKVVINDTSAAEEALQETALAMVGALPRFRGESTFRTWVSRIGRNQAIAILRRRSGATQVGFDERIGPPGAPAGAPGTDGPLARYSSLLADRTDLDVAIAGLSDEYREAVRLRDVEQRSYQEIADLLGVKLNTVRSRLARGRAQLAAALGPS